MMKTRDLLIGAFVVVLLGGLLALWLAPEGLRPMPRVTVTTLDQSRLDLASLEGRPVLVTFWATTCISCIQEIPHLRELHDRYHEQGLKVIGVAMAHDPPEQVAEMARRREINYTVGLDTTGEVAAAFGDVRLTPTSFLIAPNGRIVYQKIGEMDWHTVERHLSRWL
ncbi:Peroxiredoxin [Ectothiorhodospira magna]|uniref:Peroxiredoxin n=1 Tax=Ectothiorhodospira magna TaxID=867345 RepID=A0A1H9FUU6_9GAMM|nr:TlpA disulfide reductase family protein [Ectothiorhodospira magna]SEQ41646.1 Peroxiredoxin [Ectothiorhodospira magna]